MDKSIYYKFEEQFFTSDEASITFIKEKRTWVNSVSQDSDEYMFRCIASIAIFDTLSKNIPKQEVKARYSLQSADFLQIMSRAKADINLVRESIKRLNLCKNHVGNDKGLYLGYHLVRGNGFKLLYELNQIINEKDNYKISDVKALLESKKSYSILLNEYLSDRISIAGANTEVLIARYASVCGHMSRYIEPLFLINSIENFREKKGLGKLCGEIQLAKYLNLDAIKDKTCISVSPVILVRLKRILNRIRRNKEFARLNEGPLSILKASLDEEFENYKSQTGKTRNELIKITKELDDKIKSADVETRFIIKESLFLNEHSIYCNCERGISDDLSIYSDHDHTKIEWTKQHQLFIEQIKRDFILARESFYFALKKGKSKNSHVVDENVNDSRFYLSDKSSRLINTFKLTFSILDKVAVLYNNIHCIESNNKSVYFQSFFSMKKVKTQIELHPSNMFAFALLTIAMDLDKNSKYSAFSEYKDWRNAAEHNSIILLKDSKSKNELSELRKEYSNIEEFIYFEEFENKTRMMLQLCKSAIFTIVWHIRKETISKKNKCAEQSATDNPPIEE